MRPVWFACCLYLLYSPVFAADPVLAVLFPIPHWISTSTPGSQPVNLVRSFSADAPVQQATLKFAADFCFATVAINETEVLEVAPFVQLQTLDVTNAVQRGENSGSIRIMCSRMYWAFRGKSASDCVR